MTIRLPSETEHIYPTNDTGLSAWLVCQGYEILEVCRDYIPMKYGGEPTVFIFEKMAGIAEDVKKWQNCEAVGNCYMYEQARQKLLRMIHAPAGENIGTGSKANASQ